MGGEEAVFLYELKQTELPSKGGSVFLCLEGATGASQCDNAKRPGRMKEEIAQEWEFVGC